MSRIQEISAKSCVAVLCLLFFLVGCSTDDKEELEEQSENTSESILNQSWEDTLAEAEGSEVHFYMWGGDEGINHYIDDWVAPRLQERYNITLTRHPMDITEILQKLQTEKRAGKEDGSIDVVWINGENFKNAKENDLLWGSFTDYLPNYQQYVNKENSEQQYDFGTTIEGMEAPWGKVQYVFLYDSAKVEEPPASFADLAEWVKKNPGTFTYPEAQDFSGSGFLKHVLYDKIGIEALDGKEYNPSLLQQHSDEIWGYLNELQPHLWREGETYPSTLSDLDHLYSQGEVLFTMGYNEGRAERLIADGTFPETTRSFVMEPGSIGNLHFLSIPFNSTNTAGALVTINELLSPEAQLKKLEPSVWGDNTVLDINKLPDSYQEKLKDIERGESVLSADELQDSFLNEMDPEYTEWIKEYWISEVVQSGNN
ncbi:ABC transporter substrate-binding protein [Alteribacillus iranensis]|uniref:Putative spermidine/putrescine transport system substrate-binding protein n=1 Tax=Alteribacillus iranensis TaxID=930128 RepID=A0A1I2E9G0_9BACI|nr:ABC transporter substrate-binding protein [Alteribacillus iranensis]SFE89246.1 putative spermidine/putrescine transport system substrate-binding protein [Alteribacillus iranensis]